MVVYPGIRVPITPFVSIVGGHLPNSCGTFGNTPLVFYGKLVGKITVSIP